MLPHQLQYGTGSRTSYGTGSRTDSHRDCLINSTNSSDGSELAADFELYIVWVVRYCLGALLFRRAIVWVVSDNIQWCLNYTARISLRGSPYGRRTGSRLHLISLSLSQAGRARTVH